jgi:hypothetical protein
LTLVEAIVRGGAEKEEPISNEEGYRRLLAQLMGLSRFEDALCVLDRVVFYLEAREPLIWDVAAQFELFRGILTPDRSEDLRRLEGEMRWTPFVGQVCGADKLVSGVGCYAASLTRTSA